MLTLDITILTIVGLLVYVAREIISMASMETEYLAIMLGKILMSLPRPVMMILMAIPEQTVLHLMAPGLSIPRRLLVSIAMYVIHFAWNGMVMKPKRSHNELVWILGTALYAVMVSGVKMSTGVALVAADSVMTLALRGLG